MNILTLQLGFHDDSATLISDNRIYAVELERLSRLKHNCRQDKLTQSYTANRLGRVHVKDEDVGAVIRKVLDYLLGAAGITSGDLDVFYNNRPHLGFNLPTGTKFVTLGSHHEQHAASAFYPSGFTEAAVLVIDVFGSLSWDNPHLKETVSFWHGREGKIRNIETRYSPSYQFNELLLTKYDHHTSPGVFYMDLTILCGFGVLEAGKTMGLSPYGSDRLLGELEKFVRFDGNTGEIMFDLAYMPFLQEMKAHADDEFGFMADTAFAAQKILERSVLFYCDRLYRMTGCGNICLAGGVALNSAANGLILTSTPFEKIFIQPCAKDSGCSLGTALNIFYYFDGNRDKTLDYNNFYLGCEYDLSTVEDLITSGNGLHYRRYADFTELCAHVSEFLAEGKIIGWFQGRSEFGPRALGNRSILASPLNEKMKDILNSRIKFREWFRPFAPVVLEEDLGEYFDFSHHSPHMLIVAPVRSREIPAVTHVDGSARIQTVNRPQNDRLYSLLQAWKAKTGVPVLLNTSFNVRGEPIVETPEEALDTLVRSDLDYLVIGNLIIDKKGAI